MENGAEEAAQFETSAEISKSSDLEDASPINDRKAEEVNEIVENALSEKNLHSNEEEPTPAGDTEIEPTPVHKEPEIRAAEFTEGNPLSAVEEVSKEEKTADETISAPEFDTAIANDTDGNVELPTSHEELSKESEKEFPEAKMEANDITSTPESVETTSIAGNEHVEILATNEEVTKEENGADSIPSTEDDKETEPATTDEEHLKEKEAVGEKNPSGSAATLAVEEDEHVDSLAVHEEAPKEELPETPATIEETDIEEKGVEPAIEEELPQENVAEETQSKEESPKAASVVQDEKPVSAEADEADAGEGNTEVEPSASGLVSVEATAAEGEKDLTPGVVTEELTEDDGPADIVTGEASQELETAAPHENVKPEELESASESIETTPVEDAENVEPEALHSEEITPDETTSAIQSPEATSHVEKEGVEVPTSLEEPAEESTATEESAAAREIVGSIEDTKGVEPEAVLASESTEANPAVEDRGMEAPALDEEPTQEGTVADKLGHAPESVEDPNEGEPERVDKELNEESAEDTTPPHVELDETAGATEESGEGIPVEHDEGAEFITADGLDREAKVGDEIPSADAIPAVEEKDVEIHAEDANGTEPSSAKDEEVSGNETHSAEDLAEATPAVEDKGVEVPTPHDEPAKEETIDEVAHSQESVAEEVPSTTASEDAIPAPEDNDVDVPIPQEEVPQEEAADAAIPAVEDKEVEALTAHEVLVKEETTDDVAQHSESVAEETPLATAPKDAIPATEDKEEETVDEVSQSQEPVIPLASSSKEAIPASEDKEVDVLSPSEEPAKEEETTHEVPQSQDSAVEETPSGVDSEDVIPAAEDRSFEVPTSHAELTKDDTGRDDASLVSDSSQSTTVLDDLVEGSVPNDELSKEETTDELAQPPEFVDAKEVQPVTEGLVEQTTDDVSQPVESVAATLTEDREPSTGEQGVQSVESAADEIPLLAASDDAVGAVEDKDADMPTPHEEHPEEETTGEVAQSQQSVADEIQSTTVGEDVTPAAEDKEVVVLPLHEELPKEETADDIAQAQEAVADEVPSTADDFIPTVEDKDVDAPVPDEEPAMDEDTPDEVAQLQEPTEDEMQLPAASEGSTSAVEDKEVDVPTTHEEAAMEDNTTDEVAEPKASGEAPLIEHEKEIEPATEDKDLKMEPSAAEEVATGDSAEPIPAVEEKNVEVPTSHEEPVKEETIGDVSQPLDSVQVTPVGDSDVTNAVEDRPVEAAPTPLEEVASEDKATEVSSLAPVVESEDVEPPVPSIAKGDVEVPGHQEQLSQEDTITRELPVSVEDNKDVEPETGTEERTEEKSSAEGVSSTTDSTEPVRAAEVGNEELPTSQKEPEEVITETAEVTSKSEVEAATTPAIEDKDVEFPTQLQLSKELPVADEVPPERTEPAQAPVIEAEKEVEPAINSEAAPVTAESMEEGNDLPAEPTEIIDKHVLTADSLENGALKTVATETPEAEGDKLEEQEILLAEKSNGALTDVVEKTVEGSNPAATVDAQDGHEASAVLTTSGAKATQGRDLDPGLLREVEQEEVQNVAQQDLEEEDKVPVPLSTHASDLSSSWVNISPIQSADAQSTSAGFHSNLSQGSQSGRPENDLASSGGDDWRVVSEQDLGPAKSKDSDTGLSRPKFPFSIVLWCTQSMSTLFGGSQR